MRNTIVLGSAMLVAASIFLASCSQQPAPVKTSGNTQASTPANTTQNTTAVTSTTPKTGDQTPTAIGNLPTLTEYRSQNCRWCNKLAEELSKLKEEYKGALQIEETNMNDVKDISALNKIGFEGGIPFLVLRSAKGEVLWTKTGYMTVESISKIMKEKGISPAK